MTKKIYKLKYWIPVSSFFFISFKCIKDPEFFIYLYKLNIISIEAILVQEYNLNQIVQIGIELTPTYILCNMISIMALSIVNILYKKLNKFFTNSIFKNWNYRYYLKINQNFYSNALVMSKQLNDIERMSIAMENNSLRNVIKFFYCKKHN